MLDSAFLFSYAIAMFASGFVAERVSLRYFLSMGMILTGVFTYMFGIARTSNIHSLWYFIIVQIFAGIFQTTGWPGVVALVGRWFGKSKRGLIFGIWNSHTSIGNILGTLIAAHYVESDWALSFVVPGIIIAAVGFLLFLFLVDQPEIVGCYPQAGQHERRVANESDVEQDDEEQVRHNDAVSIRFRFFIDVPHAMYITPGLPICCNYDFKNVLCSALVCDQFWVRHFENCKCMTISMVFLLCLPFLLM